MKYIPRRFNSQNFLPGSVTQGKASKKLFVTSSSDPVKTNDTGEGYAAGTTWVNTSSGQVFICSDNSAEDSVWYGQEGDIINEPFTIAGSNGYIIGGYGNTGLVDTQEKVSFTSPANATDFGVKNVSIDFMFGLAREIEFFLISLLRMIFASTTLYDFG